MVRDGYFYGLSLAAVAALVWVLTHSVVLCALPLLLAAFFLWFFRDPVRRIPGGEGDVVSPADGKVTAIRPLVSGGEPLHHISIFLNVFNVHVNRAPIAGTIQSVQYKKGAFLNAMNPASAEQNEQNRVEVAGDDGVVVAFTQIAGLLARRIVFNRKTGDWVARGERVGLIKFGSRVDVFLPAASELKIAVGDHVRGGASVLATLPQRGGLGAAAAAAQMRSAAE
jgi:phosphatidylserine decarboxylase